MADSGGVIWITGLPASGKTTIARQVASDLRSADRFALLLDGDEFRGVVDDVNVGFDWAGRRVNAFRICRAARMLSGQGAMVVVATQSLFSDVHAWNREHLPAYFEVLLEAPFDIRASRDPKGLYARALAGELRNLAGVDLAVEAPAAPHLALMNAGGLESVPHVAATIVAAYGRAYAPRDQSPQRSA